MLGSASLALVLIGNVEKGGTFTAGLCPTTGNPIPTTENRGCRRHSQRFRLGYWRRRDLFSHLVRTWRGKQRIHGLCAVWQRRDKLRPAMDFGSAKRSG